MFLRHFLKHFFSTQDCKSENCYGCFYRLEDIGISNCLDYGSDVKITITKTKTIGKVTNKEYFISEDNKWLYAGIVCAIIFVTIITITGLIIFKKKQEIKSKLKMNLSTVDFRASV